MTFRIEHDTMGEVQVPANKYWGAQTERSRNNFKIGPEASMPKEIIHAFAYLKKAAAHANTELGVLSQEKCNLISQTCDEILTGSLDNEFPLVIWQTGSGTQSNMNVNEVVAYRAHVVAGGSLTDENKVLHPNDDVNNVVDELAGMASASVVGGAPPVSRLSMLRLSAANSSNNQGCFFMNFKEKYTILASLSNQKKRKFSEVYACEDGS
jgi:aspartate ammonia-lyase